MHPLNPYRNKPPNFKAYIEKYPEMFEGCTIGNGSELKINWQNPQAVRSVTEVMMLEDFSVRIQLKDNRLCPPLPNRLNYLCWLREIISPEADLQLPHHSTHVLDIGVGASCIYPLLGHRLFGWKFTGSDIDIESLSWSKGIIDSNQLSSEIGLVCVGSSDKVQKILEEWCGSALCQGTRQWKVSKRGDTEKDFVSSTDLNTMACDDDGTVYWDTLEDGLSNDPRELDDIDDDDDVVSRERPTAPHADITKTVRCSQAVYSASSLQCDACSSLRGPVRAALVGMDGIFRLAVETAEQTSLHPDLAQSGNIGEDIDTEGSKTVLTACMTNPPFFTPEEQASAGRVVSPSAACTGKESEMSTVGGEVAFVLAMFVDSLILKERVGWYSTMLGKKRSLRVLLRVLRAHGVTRSYSTRFLQGKKGASTVRWALAWTFLPWAISTSVCAIEKALLKKYKLFGSKKGSQHQLISLVSDPVTLSPISLLQTCTGQELNYLLHNTHASSFAERISRVKLLSFLSTREEEESLATTHSSFADSRCWCSECLLIALLLRVLSCEVVALNSGPNASSSHSVGVGNKATSATLPVVVVDRWELCNFESLNSASESGSKDVYRREDEEDKLVDGLGVFVDLSLTGDSPCINCCIHLSCCSEEYSPHRDVSDSSQTVAVAVANSSSREVGGLGVLEEAKSESGSDEPSSKRLKTEVSSHFKDVDSRMVVRMVLVALCNNHTEWDSEARRIFRLFFELLCPDIVRTNRRWRRGMKRKVQKSSTS